MRGYAGRSDPPAPTTQRRPRAGPLRSGDGSGMEVVAVASAGGWRAGARAVIGFLDAPAIRTVRHAASGSLDRGGLALGAPFAPLRLP